MFLEVINGRRASSEPTSVISASAVDMAALLLEGFKQPGGVAFVRHFDVCGGARPRLDLTPWRLDVLTTDVTRITPDPEGALRTCQFEREAGVAVVHI
jgi:hypothetical protein